MRIIAGDLKGRRLTAPRDNSVRPTSDKVKEAIFSMLSGCYEDEVVVDVFAGTGNLGLEAISRGARYCYFGDKSKESLALIRENVKNCKVEDQSAVIWGDCHMVLKRIPEKAQVIFLDPPYQDGLMISCIEQIHELDLLSEDGYIVAEHSLSEKLPETIGSFDKLKEKRYGKIAVSVYG